MNNPLVLASVPAAPRAPFRIQNKGGLLGGVSALLMLLGYLLVRLLAGEDGPTRVEVAEPSNTTDHKTSTTIEDDSVHVLRPLTMGPVPEFDPVGAVPASALQDVPATASDDIDSLMLR